MHLVYHLLKRLALAEVPIDGMECSGTASVIIGLGLDPKVTHEKLLFPVRRPDVGLHCGGQSSGGSPLNGRAVRFLSTPE